MKLNLFSVPYHLGREGVGVALGPGRYLEAGLAERLAARGHDVEVAEVRRPAPFVDELQAIVAVDGALSDGVAAAHRGGALSLAVSGDCNAALGVTGGMVAAGTAIVWFDAHGDFNTPETSPTGFLEGMPFAMACGLAHSAAWAGARGDAVDPRACVHVGGRDFDAGEAERLAAAGVRIIGAEALRHGGEGGLEAALAAVAPLAAQAYVHVDIDVLDPALVAAVDYPTPAGLTPDELVGAVGAVARQLPVRGMSVAQYDPERDDERATTLTVALDLVERLMDAVDERPRTPCDDKNAGGG